MPIKIHKVDKIDNIDNILADITKEKNKLEHLTKKVINNNSRHNKKIHTIKNNTHNTHNTLDNEINENEFDFKNTSPQTVKTLIDMLKNYIVMDKSYRDKHEDLKSLYNEYNNSYKNSNNNAATPDINHQDILKTIHTEMKNNNSNLYRDRVFILKKIKNTPEIEPPVKNKICGKLLNIFKSPPISDYTQLPILKQSSDMSGIQLKNESSHNNTVGNHIVGNNNVGNHSHINKNNNNKNDKISINELDDAYLQKHNELMTVYKAYQNLFNKVLNYKSELDKYKQLPTTSSISRSHMDNLIKDQSFVMSMIEKMQDKLVSNNIISTTEKVPVNPVASNPENIAIFNDTMREQIRSIVDRQVEIKPNMKAKLENLLNKYKECDSNDKFCQEGRKLLIMKNT